MAEIAIAAVTTALTTVGVPTAIATPFAAVAVNTAFAVAGNAAAGCCAPLRSEGGGPWLEEAP